MVCCCDPFEPLSPEELQHSAEMVKDMQAEKTSQASSTSIASTIPADSYPTDRHHEAANDMEELLVSVVLPPGVLPGQKIEVRSPNGSRTVDTIIPVGLHPGQAFLVKFPSIAKKTLKLQGSLASEQEREEAESERGDGERDDTVDEIDQSPSFVQVLDNFLTPKPDQDVIEALEKARREATEYSRKVKPPPTPEGLSTAVFETTASKEASSPSAAKRSEDNEEVQSLGSKSAPSVVSSHIKKVTGEAVQASVTRVSAEPILDLAHDKEEAETKKNQECQTQEELYTSSSFVKSLEDFFTPKPDVPPSTMDSETSAHATPHPTTLQTTPNQKLVLVHVPSELPPGTTIYVEIPGESRTVAALVPPGVSTFHVAYTPQLPINNVRAPPMMASGDMVLRQPQVGREKLLSVRVPPGTLPGTTLHISVPDEPGRILAAQVPPGNVKKFHVSYIPREQSGAPGSGMLPPASPYQQQRTPNAAYLAGQDKYAPYKEVAEGDSNW